MYLVCLTDCPDLLPDIGEWNPDDGRNYDYAALGAASDLLFVMSYDVRSFVTDRCIASANAPLSAAVRGVSRYIQLGVPRSKIVLGIPWYGYVYPCMPPALPRDRNAQLARQGVKGQYPPDASSASSRRFAREDYPRYDVCLTAEVPFNIAGTNSTPTKCSDQIGAQWSFAEIMLLLDQGQCASAEFASMSPGGVRKRSLRNCSVVTELRRDSATRSPYFTFVAAGTAAGSAAAAAIEEEDVYQVWYDDAASIRAKVEAAAALGIRGVGPYEYKSVDLTQDGSGVAGFRNDAAPAESMAMWQALRPG